MNKYFAHRTQVGKEVFDSKKEARRWQELCILERAGKIHGLKRQVNYLLLPAKYDDSGKKVKGAASYRADFVYWKEGQLVVEDVKGYRKGPAYQLFVLKSKLMYDVYGIDVKEI